MSAYFLRSGLVSTRGAYLTADMAQAVAPDVTAPSHSAGPVASNITESAADILGTLDENADVRVIIVDDGAGQPTTGEFDAVSATAATSGVEYSISFGSITGSPGDQKDAWVEARDAAGNRGVSKVDFQLANVVNLGNVLTLRNYDDTADITDGSIEYRVELESDDSLVIGWTTGTVTSGELTIDDQALGAVGRRHFIDLRRGSSPSWTLLAKIAVEAEDLNA